MITTIINRLRRLEIRKEVFQSSPKEEMSDEFR
jgi:hypothetical protein